MERKVDRSGQKGQEPSAPALGGGCSAAGAPALPMGPGRFCEASEGKTGWIHGSCVLAPGGWGTMTTGPTKTVQWGRRSPQCKC